MILYKKRITKALISLPGCTGWSGPLLFANPEDRFSHVEAHIMLDLNSLILYIQVHFGENMLVYKESHAIFDRIQSKLYGTQWKLVWMQLRTSFCFLKKKRVILFCTGFPQA